MTVIDVVDLGREVEYGQALELQRRTWSDRVDGTVGDRLYLLEHRAVYTAGVNTRPEDRRGARVPLVDADRGGRVTWHGPGQLVGYPIVDIGAGGRAGEFVRAVEELLIASCAEFGLPMATVPGRPGVWTVDGRRKVAAIGLRVRRGVTMHGFAVNCAADFAAFDEVTPCGITDAMVTSMSAEAGADVSTTLLRGVLTRLVGAGALNLRPDGHARGH